jgi:Mn-dependent DtxR family transcriptional regulator
MTNQEIRFKILKLLYGKEKKSPRRGLGDSDLMEELGISKEELNFNINYLEEKGWVRLDKTFGGFTANITAEGIDLVEDENGLKSAFPKLNLIIQNGQVNIANQESSNNITNVSIINYEDILRQVDQLPNADEVRPHVQTIQEEDGKPEDQRDKNKIIQAWDFIKQNAPTIAQLLLPIIKKLLGLE